MSEVAKIEDALSDLEQVHVREKQLIDKLKNRIKPILDLERPPPVNCTPEEWVKALLDQARSDLASAEALSKMKDADDHATTIAMLLQMVFEKIAKAYLARTDWKAFVKHRRKHTVAKRLIEGLRRMQFVLAIGPKSSTVYAWVLALTDAHPALAKDGPHLEYPWEAGSRVCNPAANLPIVRDIGSAKTLARAHLLKFAKLLIEEFDRHF